MTTTETREDHTIIQKTYTDIPVHYNCCTNCAVINELIQYHQDNIISNHLAKVVIFTPHSASSTMVFGRLLSLVLGGEVETPLPTQRQIHFNRFDVNVASRAISNNLPPSHGIPSLTKTLEAAVLVLKLARHTDPALLRNPKVDVFFEYLAEVERNVSNLSRIGFQGLKVLCVEGLSGSGKTTLVRDLINSASSGVTFVEATIPREVSEVRPVFGNCSPPATAALAFAINYCIAYQIIKNNAESTTGTPSSSSSSSSKRQVIVVIDQFYHAVCAQTAVVGSRNRVTERITGSNILDLNLNLNP